MRHVYLALVMLVASLAVLAADKPKYDPPTKEEAMAVQKQGRYLATITMESGKKIEIVLEGQYMPFTVANFVKLAKAKFYDGLAFVRIVGNAFVQGGDPKGDTTGGPGYTINFEVSPFLSHKRGAISMVHVVQIKEAKNAEAGEGAITVHYPNSGGSQFIIAKSDISALDGNFAVFGWVKDGMDVVEKIRKDDDIRNDDIEKKDLVMRSVVVAPYKGTEKCPLLVDGSAEVKASAEKDDKKD